MTGPLLVIGSQTQKEFPSIEDLAHYWRAQCLDLYAAGERSVSDCLEAVRDAKLVLSKESAHPGHKARARSLEDVLQQTRFHGHAKKALRYLRDWQALYEDRVWLAHGMMVVTTDAASFEYCDYSMGTLKISPLRSYTVGQMRERLLELRESWRRMDQQFNQIEAACRRGDL